ncbi:RebB family R body protein [Dyella sp.]|uniref:RebB family R body protein n=1 Tax=Dyella sp. TaxID=1869338 RepID=UPI002ED60299
MTAVNPQITDAVTQSNVKVVGEAPAMAVAALYQHIAHATGLGLQNAVANQQSVSSIAMAVVTRSAQLLSTTPHADEATP